MGSEGRFALKTVVTQLSIIGQGVTGKLCCTCFEWHMWRQKMVYRDKKRELEPGIRWAKHTRSADAPPRLFAGR
jgi:hypothetical protein